MGVRPRESDDSAGHVRGKFSYVAMADKSRTWRFAPTAGEDGDTYSIGMQIKCDSSPSTTDQLPEFTTRFQNFVADKGFPCVGAKSALNRGRLEFGLYDALTEERDVASMCSRRAAFSASHPAAGVDPVSFVAMFRRPTASEQVFHATLWAHLQAMHELDRIEHPWDATVSADVDDKEFSFSVAARAFFVVGLHPGASRMARRAPFPCLVFNFHDQFEALRASGRYEKMQTATRGRDIAVQGNINPVLARFGEASEAQQYSALASAARGACPFHARQAS